MQSFYGSDFQDYYELLGVSPEADEKTLRRAYLARLKAWHPDKNAADIARAEEMTKTLNEAYYVLRDPGRRRQYDRMRRFTRGKQWDEYLNEAAFGQKMKQAGPVFRHLRHNVRELYNLFVDAVKKRYPLNSARLGIIGSGLLYFILPADFIPDFIPVGGLLDDFAILTLVVNSLQEELTSYRLWKNRT